MLRVDWSSFGNAIRAHALADAKHMTEVRDNLGLSQARMVNAAQGKPVGTEILLTLCDWMKQDPMWFCVELPRAALASRSNPNDQR